MEGLNLGHLILGACIYGQPWTGDMQVLRLRFDRYFVGLNVAVAGILLIAALRPETRVVADVLGARLAREGVDDRRHRSHGLFFDL